MDKSSTEVTSTIVSPYAILNNWENYEDWKAQLESYLESQDLFDVVQLESKPPKRGAEQIKEWKKKNAAALHAIQVACGLDVFPVIRGINSAKIAWSSLARRSEEFKKFKRESWAQEPIREDDLDADLDTEVVHKFEPLYKAIVKGDWRSVKKLIAKDPEGKIAGITLLGETALDVAICWGQVRIVEELVKLLTVDEFEMIIKESPTTLIRAIAGTSFPIAKCVIEKQKKLLSEKFGNSVPIVYANVFGRDNITRYLYDLTPLKDLIANQPESNGVAVVAESMLDHKTFDIALDLVKRCPSFTITPSQFHLNRTPLLTLAARKSSFSGGRTLVFWKRWIYNHIKIEGTLGISHATYVDIEEQEEDAKGQSLRQKIYGYLYDKSGIKKIYRKKLIHAQSCEFLRRSWEHIKTLKHLDLEKKLDMVMEAISVAVEEGNAGFVIELMKLIPQPIFLLKLFPLAVENREAEIFSILYGLPLKGTIIRTTYERRNNLLHLAAKLAPPSKLESISGAALQMQREVQWFTEVKKIAKTIDNESLNEDGFTPEEVFRDNHKKLMEDGETWMKGTANSCTVAAALIITIMFAAAFTTPSGKKEGEESGTATVRDKWFLIYIASDAISLFSSTTSALIFLGILTSRYHEGAFLKSLPTQMIIGLSTLFISIAAMMTCFCAGLYVILQGDLWIFIPLILFASVPVSSFAFLQFPTLVEMIISTYGSGPFDPKIFHKLLRD